MLYTRYLKFKGDLGLIYFDNSATTKPCAEAVEAYKKALTETWGNPSSLHKLGIEAENAVSRARHEIAAALSALDEEIVFTSGATESNNTAVFSAALTRGKRRKKIITTAIEHPSVSEPVKRLEEAGFEVVRIFPDKNGKISRGEILSHIDKNTLLVSVMLVNNETGAMFDVAEAFHEIKLFDKEIYTHTDAVQGFLKTPINAKKLGADMISVSGHKVYAPKGVGALYIKKGLNLKPFLVGGGQEKGRRSGTESVPLISAFGAAAAKFSCDINERLGKVLSLRKRLAERLGELNGAFLHDFESTLPYVASVTVERIKSETLLHFLESREIFVSSGSACSKGKKSEVLKTFGYSDKELDSTIRVSFCAGNTPDEVDALVDAIADAQKTLVKIGR